MEEKKDLLEKWLEFREEELEAGLSKEDKKHMYDFEKCADMVLNCQMEKCIILLRKKWTS